MEAKAAPQRAARATEVAKLRKRVAPAAASKRPQRHGQARGLNLAFLPELKNLQQRRRKGVIAGQ
jgi:hypothetical protein